MNELFCPEMEYCIVWRRGLADEWHRATAESWSHYDTAYAALLGIRYMSGESGNQFAIAERKRPAWCVVGAVIKEDGCNNGDCERHKLGGMSEASKKYNRELLAKQADDLARTVDEVWDDGVTVDEKAFLVHLKAQLTTASEWFRECEDKRRREEEE